MSDTSQLAITSSIEGESEATEASDQDDSEPEESVPEDTTDLFTAVSSTTFAPLKGPSDISRSKEDGPVQPCSP
ncbi:hypothetical protein CHARACLAT_031380 [Characodon lateralis]|uniref:Uncharacterized protein n=1 Tax=Characodon lateralis TaxID=208331 RepID=A0ABU7CV55_9TELE|nr:hypothetical protein [Characodon lateralis]